MTKSSTMSLNSLIMLLCISSSFIFFMEETDNPDCAISKYCEDFRSEILLDNMIEWVKLWLWFVIVAFRVQSRTNYETEEKTKKLFRFCVRWGSKKINIQETPIWDPGIGGKDFLTEVCPTLLTEQSHGVHDVLRCH